MYHLKNNILDVTILDPIKDQHFLGSRYCTGGYIWQISHFAHGPLLSGPFYPQTNPPPFDGQGFPEVFESAAPDSDIKAVDSPVLIPGVGLVKKSSPIIPFHARNNPEVISFCSWKISISSNSIMMKTAQSFGQFQCSITREITLIDLVVTSKTSFQFSGARSYNLCWFAHPFFPLNVDFKCCHFSVPVIHFSNDAFSLDNNSGILQIQPSFDYSKSSYTLLDIPSNSKLSIHQFHPSVGKITVSTDFPVSKMPVWTNKNTFSFEPYFQACIEENQKITWTMQYHF
ncbi:MAG TPA: hypothetical protein VHO70_06890 [Chitinispirillaceae bacterium]|nr:hypothetical protein [Chitinispirillaceae bacterium]